MKNILGAKVNSQSFKLSFIDYSFVLMDTNTRPLDFVIIMELKDEIDLVNLEKGARLAFENYPKSNCLIKGKFFRSLSSKWEITSENNNDIQDAIKKYISTPFDITKERGIRQLFLCSGDKKYLVTRFHHALGDYLSFAMWLKTQFTHLKNQPLVLKIKDFEGKRPIKSPYQYPKKSNMPGNHIGQISSKRHWLEMTFLKPFCDSNLLGFSYNDLLCAIILETLRDYNDFRELKDQKNSLYIPINIRENPLEGFGNGTGRIKVYDCFENEISYLQKAKNIRKQIQTCKKIGFWKMPEKLGFLDFLPRFISKFLISDLGMSLSEPGSLIFSHIERLTNFEEIYSKINHITCLSQLHKVYPMALSAHSLNDKTILTLTWDDALVNSQQAQKFMNFLDKNLKEAISQLK